MAIAESINSIITALTLAVQAQTYLTDRNIRTNEHSRTYLLATSSYIATLRTHQYITAQNTLPNMGYYVISIADA
jgi:hypothetical protein